MEHEIGDGFADDIGAADDDNFGTLGFDSTANDEFLDACGRAGRKFDSVATDEEAPGVDGVKAVDVFVGIDRVEHLIFVDVLGEWELDENAVYGVVLVVFFDECEECVFADVVRLLVLYFVEAEFESGFDLECYV